MDKCVRAVISGRVQGVFFRAFTQEEAERLKLTGWVRNLPSGDVEALIVGPGDQVDKMIDWFATGSPHSRVDHVAVDEVANPDVFNSFSIRY